MFPLQRKDRTYYHFDASDALSSIVDRNGNILTYAYDGAGRLSTITDTVGRVFTLQYDAGGHVIELDIPGTQV